MNVKILGTTALIISTLTLEQLKKLETYAPKALELKEDNEVVFKVAVGNQSNINKYGVTFNDTYKRRAACRVELAEAGKNAMITGYGKILYQLKEVEMQAEIASNELQDVLDSIAPEIEEV